MGAHQHVKDILRRLLITNSIETRNPETDQPFKLASGEESWVYCDVRRTILQPHGLFGISRMLLQHFVEGGVDGDEYDIGAVAGSSSGGIPLTVGFILAAYEYDHSSAPAALLVRKDTCGTGNPVEGLDNVAGGAGVLIVDDLVAEGTSIIHTIRVLREAGLSPKHVICVVDLEQGGLQAIRNETGVKATALFELSSLLEPLEDDHILFLPDPNKNNDGYFYLPGPGGWQPCTPEHNEWLKGVEGTSRIKYKGEREETIGTTGVFYLDGILKP